MTFTQAQINAEIDTQIPNNHANQVSPATMRGVLHDMTSYATQSSPAVTPELFGATNPNVDAFSAFTQAIAAATSLGVPIVLSNRVYLTSQTLNFGAISVNGTVDSTIRGTTNNMLVVQDGILNQVTIDGNNQALWGWFCKASSGDSPSSVRGYNVTVNNNTEYGIITNGIQNNTFIGTFCQNNAVANLVLANGTKNCNFYNCTLNSNQFGLPNAVNLLLLYDSSNPHGFGLSTSWGTTNDQNNFWGGIMERTGVTNIKTLNPAAFASNQGEINFYQYEFDGVSQITFDSTSQAVLNFHDCPMQGDGSGAALAVGAGNGASIFFYNTVTNVKSPGGYNTAGIDFGCTCNNNFSKMLNFSLANFANNAPFGSSGVTSATYVPLTRQIDVITTAGNGFVSFFSDNASSIGWRALSCDRLPLLRISFTISGLVGATDVNLLITGSGTNLGNFAAGASQVLYRAQNTDDGGFRFRTNGSGTAWSVSNVTLEYL